MSTVSVIIPNLNRADLLPTTLESVLNQTVAPHEVIVADGGSIDHFEEIKSRYAGRVTFVRNEGDGPGAGRNTGLKHATGKYIKFFDSDDVMTRNTIEEQLKVLERTNSPVVYSPYIYAKQQIDGSWVNTDVIIQYKPIPKDLSLRQCMVRGFFTVIPGMMFNAEFLRQIGPWRTDIAVYEDWDLLWRMGKVCPRPEHTAACAMFYRLHGAQTVGHYYTNEERDYQKLICMTQALASIQVYDKHFTPFDKQLLATQIYHTLLYYKGNPRFEKWAQEFNGGSYPIIDIWRRAISKFNRLITNSNWQGMHGINSEPSVFSKYVALLSPEVKQPLKELA